MMNGACVYALDRVAKIERKRGRMTPADDIVNLLVQSIGKPRYASRSEAMLELLRAVGRGEFESTP